jgi:hypothetical protein
VREHERLRKLLRAAHALGAAGLLALAAAMAFSLPARAQGDATMVDALELCLDNALTLEARGEGFEAAGWTRSEDTALADAALAEAILISFLRPEQPDTWADAQARSRETASRLRERRGYDALMLYARDSATVAVEPNADGLPTCLYTGPPAPLDPVADAVRALAIVDFGAQTFVQGRAPAAQVVAYSMAAGAMVDFPEPLTYGTIFTTILDRRATQ